MDKKESLNGLSELYINVYLPKKNKDEAREFEGEEDMEGNEGAGRDSNNENTILIYEILKNFELKNEYITTCVVILWSCML